MKKTFSLILLTLFLMFFSFVIFPVKVFAALISADDWYNYISQFEFGLVKGEVLNYGSIKIVEEPGHEYDAGDIIQYGSNHYEDMFYFEPGLAALASKIGRVVAYLEEHYEDFDGHFYWNFEEKYWQVEYYELSELDYYKQRVDDLEDEIQDLEDEISLLEDEIQDLEDEISLLEDEIQDLEDEISLLEDEIQQLENEKQQLEDEIQRLEDENSLLEDEISSLEDEISLLEDEIQRLEEALDLEYDRGYNDGYEIGYSEGLLVENNDINIIKWFVPLVVIIIIVGIIEPIMLFKRRG